MKIVYMGTPDFAVPCLRKLVESSSNEVIAVFTQPDKPKGRGYKIMSTPVKITALEYNIPVYQPLSLQNGDNAKKFIKIFNDINIDLIVVTAYGQILPKEFLKLPKYGCINIHASLLPKYRGAAPINWVLINGEKITGVTSILMNDRLDTGDMLIRRSTEIGDNETYSTLYTRLSIISVEVLMETLARLEAGTLVPEKQDDALSCYSPMIRKEMSVLDFTKSVNEVHNIIRGVTGFTTLGNKRLKVFKSKISDNIASYMEAGSIVDPECFAVRCSDGVIIFDEVQLEGSKRMKTADFLRGKKLNKGEILGKNNKF